MVKLFALIINLEGNYLIPLDDGKMGMAAKFAPTYIMVQGQQVNPLGYIASICIAEFPLCRLKILNLINTGHTAYLVSKEI